MLYYFAFCESDLKSPYQNTGSSSGGEDTRKEASREFHWQVIIRTRHICDRAVESKTAKHLLERAPGHEQASSRLPKYQPGNVTRCRISIPTDSGLYLEKWAGFRVD